MNATSTQKRKSTGKMPDEIVEMCRKSVVAFNTALNPRFLAPPRHIQIIGRLLDRIACGESVNATISVPRRHAKSETATIGFPKYYLGRNPYNSIISASYSQTLSDKFGRAISEGMQAKEYLNIFPEGALNPKGLNAAEFRTSLGG